MEFWVSVVLLVLAIAGLVAGATLLRQRKTLRVVCIALCALLALFCVIYIALTLILIGGIQAQPPTP